MQKNTFEDNSITDLNDSLESNDEDNWNKDHYNEVIKSMQRF